MLEHKSGNISETRKIEKKLLWKAYRNSPTLFRAVPFPTPWCCHRMSFVCLSVRDVGGL